MKNLETVCRILICIFEVFLYYDFFKDIFEYKVKSNKKRFLIFVFLICSLIIINALNNSLINLLAVPIMYLVIHQCLYRSPLKMRCLYVTIFYFISAGIEIGFAILTSTVSNSQMLNLVSNPNNKLFFLLFGKTITFLILRVIKTIFRKSEYTINYKLFRWFFILPFTSLILYSGFSYSDLNFENLSKSKVILVIGCFLLLFSNVIVFYLFEKLSYTMYQASELKLLNIKHDMEQIHFETLEKVNQEHRKYIHNIQHYMKTIAVLAHENENDKIISIIQEMNFTVQNINEKIYCSNSILNAILCERCAEAEGRNINFRVFITPTLNVEVIKDFDLIAMVGNLLDNAIEAASFCDKEKYIDVQMISTPNENFMTLRVENNFALKPKKIGSIFQTLKENKDNHGIGIENVKELAKKYGGFLYLEVEQNVFIASLNLPVSKQTALLNK